MSARLLLLLAPFAERPGPLFVDISSAALPGVVTTCGSPAKDWILEVNGGGLALGDFDGDQDLDLVIVDGSTLERVAKKEPGFPPRLFLNRGDGRFEAAGERWAIAPGRWGTGCATGDLDGDGDLDLVLTEWGRARLLLNDERKGFREVAENGLAKADEWGTSAAVCDFDADGLLDLLVVNYIDFDVERIAKKGAGECRWKGHDVMCGPEGLTPQHDRLYRGKGDGTFVEVTRDARLVPDEPGFGLGAMTLDYDQDGDTDLYVANDSTPNFLWENQGDGTFREVGMQRGVSHDKNGREQASMGVAAGDVDGDGRAELLVSNFSGEGLTLYASRGERAFAERAGPAGLNGPTLQSLGWGVQLADLDLDGDLDAAAMHGHVYPEADRAGTDTSYAQPALLFRGDGKGRFAAEPLSAGPPLPLRASALGDLDADGDLDLVALAIEGPVRVFRNDAARSDKTHWLAVRLVARTKNRDALGARIVAQAGERRWSAEVRTSGGFQAAVPALAHFGLGAAAKLDKLSVRWPSGKVQELADVAVDRALVVEEPE